MNLFFVFTIIFCNGLCASSNSVLWEQVTANTEYGDTTTRFVLNADHFKVYDVALSGAGKTLPVDNPGYAKTVASSQEPRVMDGSYIFCNNSERKILHTDGLGDCVGIVAHMPGNDGFSAVYHCTQMELFGPRHQGLSDRFESDFLAKLTKRVGEADKSEVQIYLAATYLTDSVTEIVIRLSNAGFTITETSFPRIAIDRTSPRGQNVYMLAAPLTSVSYDSVIYDLTSGVAIDSATGEVFVSRVFRRA